MKPGILPARTSVGASLLAMVLNDYAGTQMPGGDVAFFASRLAPTGIVGVFEGWLKNNHRSVAYTICGLQTLSLRLSTGSSTGIVGKASTAQ
ncbi:hypothetical protein DOZ80_27555 [Pseudomonas fluorescens]|uniref:Uncharacterized protein n=1 Tax=Pseudomonas fluorescens TaxID=294 RepID=A0A327MNQ0_PSEFL|nr:hypothetical protein DOZ80_27555 [Pseudomonas fluorescens]